jgi:hypothetical protein
MVVTRDVARETLDRVVSADAAVRWLGGSGVPFPERRAVLGAAPGVGVVQVPRRRAGDGHPPAWSRLAPVAARRDGPGIEPGRPLSAGGRAARRSAGRSRVDCVRSGSTGRVTAIHTIQLRRLRRDHVHRPGIAGPGTGGCGAPATALWT